MRIGHGYDVHRLQEGLPLLIGGEHIPHGKGCVAHSDGDVLVHAIIDALFGAASLPDIGSHYPDSDPQYRGICSMQLLSECVCEIRGKLFEIEYVDATILAQTPKMAPYIQNMRKNLADTMRIPLTLINIKATTEEYLGFTGREEGIAAHAVCLLKKTNGL